MELATRAHSEVTTSSWNARIPAVPFNDWLKGFSYLAVAAAVLAGIWQLSSFLSGNDLPGPIPTLAVLWRLISDPFYDNGPNDMGIGIQLASSLARVLWGFILGTVVAVPLGVLLGASGSAKRIIDPLVQLLRPISPLAWFPIGLAAAHSAGTATVFIIFITSLWPTAINTAFGVSSIPESHKNVARVFHFSRRKYLQHVVIPYSLPYVLTGLRLSMGIAWLVIVAAEMLSGAKGIGWFVWDSWNALDLKKVMSAVLIIGAVGLVIDRLFLILVKRASYGEAT